MLNNSSILITGGTGSFGQKFVELVLQRFRPKRLIIFSRDELKQFEMQQVFSQSCMRYFLGDVRDRGRVEEAMQDVDYVIHAAALKQVPAAEYNPMECIKTNIYGAENVIWGAIKNQVRKVIVLSTDKAASPINLYGATKLAADKLFVAANNIVGRRHTRFSMARYGNVLGSRGSIVPVFQQLVEKKAATIPITHADMTRFMITLEQGVESVLHYLEIMQGGEIFVPKMPSMRIIDLASALAPGIPQKIVGLRPGDRIHEILCAADESHLTLEWPDYYLICPAIQFAKKIDFTLGPRNASGAAPASGPSGDAPSGGLSGDAPSGGGSGNVPGNTPGKRVPEGFAYTSLNNKNWLSPKAFLELIKNK